MNTKFFLKLFILLIIATSMVQCTEERDINAFQNLQNDSRVKELLLIRNKIGDKVINGNVDITQLHQAYLDKDTTLIKKLIGFSESEYNEMRHQLNNLRNSLLNDYPNELKEVSTECSNCTIDESDINQFFNNFDSFVNFSRDNNNGNNDNNGCDSYIQYTMCLIACTTTGPVIYWPCAYLCYCSYCDGSATICNVL